MLKPAYGYLRVSGKEQETGDGFPRQRVAIANYARANGYRITHWFEERAIPGKTEWENRPAWLAMITALNGVDTIVIETLNRLARDLMVQEHIIADLRARHVTLISAMEPDLCVDDPSRKLLRQIMGAISEYDRAMITAKLSGARKRMKAATGRCEGRKPYGETPEERQAIEVMKHYRLKGMSFAEIAAEMNKTAYKTASQKYVNAKVSPRPWGGSAVCKILARELPEAVAV